MTARFIEPKIDSITSRNWERLGSGTNSMVGPLPISLVRELTLELHKKEVLRSE